MKTTRNTFSRGPEFTHKGLQYLIGITCAATLGLPFLDALSGAIFGVTGLQYLFSLNQLTITHYFLWQPISYMFLLQSMGGISFPLFISLAFRMYVLWMMGSAIIDRFGIGAFFRLFLGSGILTAFTLLGIMTLAGTPIIWVGNTPPLFAIFTVWCMLNPRGIIYLFFVFPIQVKWLLAGILGANLLINLSNGDLIAAASTATATTYAYLYSTAAWGLHTPFPATRQTDELFSRWGDKIYEILSGIVKRDSYSKIYDMRARSTQQKDEEFIDAMLEKISKKGEGSLWFWERWRLSKISKKNKKL